MHLYSAGGRRIRLRQLTFLLRSTLCSHVVIGLKYSSFYETAVLLSILKYSIALEYFSHKWTCGVVAPSDRNPYHYPVIKRVWEVTN